MYHFYAVINRMKYINRWGLMRNTDRENLKEHSFQVAVLAHALALIEKERFGQTIDVYKDIEKEANALLVKKLPEDMQPTYSELLSEEDTPEHRCVKAADTLSAYIKCVEELKAGNREFEGAAKSIKERLEQIPLKSVRVFIDEFLESYSLTLDEQS